MIRLLGILVGATIAVAILIVVVGVPEFPDSQQAAADAQPRFELPREAELPPIVDAPLEPVAEVEAMLQPDTAARPAPAPRHDPASQPDTAVQKELTARVEPGVPPQPSPPPLEEVAVTEETVERHQPAGTSVATHWYAFWSPFRSEIAANGFVAQLQRTTGIDYRVVKQQAGVYEVAFAYADDADIEKKLAQISAATGLDLPES